VDTAESRPLYGPATKWIDGVCRCTIQIAALFASSPPFPTTELPPKDHGTGKFGSMRGISASALEQTQQRRRVAAAVEEDGYAPSNATNPSTIGGIGVD